MQEPASTAVRVSPPGPNPKDRANSFARRLWIGIYWLITAYIVGFGFASMVPQVYARPAGVDAGQSCGASLLRLANLLSKSDPLAEWDRRLAELPSMCVQTGSGRALEDWRVRLEIEHKNDVGQTEFRRMFRHDFPQLFQIDEEERSAAERRRSEE